LTTHNRGFGFSFWIIPIAANIGPQLAIEMGDFSNYTWFITTYTMCNAVTSMVFGSYSDLFGRRWFIIVGNAIVFAGLVIAGCATNTGMFIAACAISGSVQYQIL